MVNRKGALDDFVRGADTTVHSAKMAFFSTLTVSLVPLVIAIFVSTIFVHLTTSSVDRTLAAKFAYNSFLYHVPKKKLGRVDVNFDEKLYTITRSEFVGLDWVKERSKNVYSKVAISFLLGLIVGAILLVLIIVRLRIRGRNLREDEFVRGAKRVDPKDLAQILRSLNVDSKDLKIGDVPLLNGSETTHISISGAPGTGKTVALMQLADAIRARGDAAIVYDKTGAFVEKYYSECDTILSAVDERSPTWSPWDEITHPADYERIAATLVPDEKEGEKIWGQAARSVLVAALGKIKKSENRSIVELLKKCLFTDIKELSKMLRGTEASLIINEDNPKTALSVTMNIAANIRSFKYLRDDSKDHKNGRFSVTNWIDSVSVNNNKSGWLFITSKDRFHEAVKPLITTWIDSAASAILSLNPNRDRRIWLILDEFPSLGELNSVKKLMAEGRQYGACVVLGYQSYSQVKEIYGEDGAETMSGLCKTRVVLAAPDPETAEWNSKALGEEDVSESKESLQYGVAENRDSMNLSSDRKLRKVVLPTEIMQMKNLTAWIRLPEDYPVAKTELKIVDRESKSAPYIPVPIEETVWQFFEDMSAEISNQSEPNDKENEGNSIDSADVLDDSKNDDEDILFGR